VLVLAGTGRTAAEIAAARAGSATDPCATAVAVSSLVTVVPDDPTALIAELTRLLRP
jgi:hypothetical protein